jgi:hypothetical protein
MHFTPVVFWLMMVSIALAAAHRHHGVDGFYSGLHRL